MVGCCKPRAHSSSWPSCGTPTWNSAISPKGRGRSTATSSDSTSSPPSGTTHWPRRRALQPALQGHIWGPPTHLAPGVQRSTAERPRSMRLPTLLCNPSTLGQSVVSPAALAGPGIAPWPHSVPRVSRDRQRTVQPEPDGMRLTAIADACRTRVVGAPPGWDSSGPSTAADILSRLPP